MNCFSQHFMKASLGAAYYNRKLHSEGRLESRTKKNKTFLFLPLAFFSSQLIMGTSLFCDIANCGSKGKFTEKSKWKFSISKKKKCHLLKDTQ